MSRVLQNLPHTITQGYKPTKHIALDLTGLFKKVRVCDYITAHTEGTVTLLRTTIKSGGAGSEWNGSYGNYVKLDHGNGWETLYAHLQYNSIKVKKGDKVKTGQVLAYMGSTGHSTGAHLHFEIRYKGVKVDPTKLIDTDLPIIKEVKPVIENVAKGTIEIFNKVEDMSKFYQKDIQELIDRKVLKGNTEGDLKLTEDMIRVLVVMNRLYNL